VTSEMFVADALLPRLGNSSENRKTLHTWAIGLRCSSACLMPMRYFGGIAGRRAWQENCYGNAD